MKSLMKSEFGKLSQAYSVARLGYPQVVIDNVVSFADKKAKILDIGCGTGIATRQLAQNGFKVFACDSDKKMIEEANKYPKENIRYYTADAKSLPFDNESFDLVTAFGAFHWFCDEVSITEIRRAMKRDSIFCVVNKNDVGNFKKDFSNIIYKIISKKVSSVKDAYDPTSILKKYGFMDVKENKIETSEYFTIEKALLQFQSMHLWNNVPGVLRKNTLESLKKHFSSLSENGLVRRDIEVVTVVGRM